MPESPAETSIDELRLRASQRWRRVTWTVTILFFAMVLVSAAITGSVPWVLLLQAGLFMLGAASLNRSVLQLTHEEASVQTLLRTRQMRWEHVAVLVAEPRRWSGAAPKMTLTDHQGRRLAITHLNGGEDVTRAQALAVAYAEQHGVPIEKR